MGKLIGMLHFALLIKSIYIYIYINVLIDCHVVVMQQISLG